MTTKAELLKALEKYPDDMRIMTPGFDEGGYADLKTVEEKELVKTRETSSHSGIYQEPQHVWPQDRVGEPLKVILLNW